MPVRKLLPWFWIIATSALGVCEIWIFHQNPHSERVIEWFFELFALVSAWTLFTKHPSGPFLIKVTSMIFIVYAIFFLLMEGIKNTSTLYAVNVSILAVFSLLTIVLIKHNPKANHPSPDKVRKGSD